MEAELIERVKEAAADKIPLCLRGGGSKAFYGRRCEGQVGSHVEAERPDDGDAVELAGEPAHDEGGDEPDREQDARDLQVPLPVLLVLFGKLHGSDSSFFDKRPSNARRERAVAAAVFSMRPGLSLLHAPLSSPRSRSSRILRVACIIVSEN